MAQATGNPPQPPRRSERQGNNVRISIAIKFAVFITVLMIVFMVAITLAALSQAEQAQQREVNDKGIELVGALTAALEPQWFIEDNRQAMENLLGKIQRETEPLGFINALVYDAEGHLLATGKRESQIRVSKNFEAIESHEAAKASVNVSEFRYEEKPIRSFRRIIEGRVDKKIKKVGEVEILLSATRIEESKTEMRNRMLSFAIPICLIAAFSSFFLAAFFARPIRALARDLKQISLGHLEHQSKVTSNDEIGELAKNFNQMAGGLKAAQDLLIIQKANEHELNLATKIQQRLLPSKTPKIPHLDLSSYYESAKQIGGDYYDFIRIDKEHLGVVVADVSGKGVPGSLVMTMTRGLLRMAAKNNTDPVEVIQSLNKALTQDIPTGMFVTLLYFIIHVPTNKLTLVRAGHNAPLLISKVRNKAAFLGPDGIALGLDPSGMIFNNKLKPQRITLQPGDVLVNYTDGIIEAKDSAGNDYTEKRFSKIVRDNLHLSAEELKTKILDDVAKHTKGFEQSDDITLVVLKVV